MWAGAYSAQMQLKSLIHCRSQSPYQNACTRFLQVSKGIPLHCPSASRLTESVFAGASTTRPQSYQAPPCSVFAAQHLLGTSFAASSLQQNRQQMPITSLLQLSAQRQPHQIAVLQWDFDDDDASSSRPQSIGSIAKYGDGDVNLTRTIILTPTREVDRIITPPAVTVPLRADSVRRKRKHKMNKHKHKKRRKLQRHKN